MSLSVAQLEQRRLGIGASDIAAVAGLNPFKKAVQVWAEKTGFDVAADEEGEPGERDEDADAAEETMSQSLGHYAEPAMLAWYRDRVGPVRAAGDVTRAHPEIPWALATPDGIATPKRGVECKLVGFRTSRYWGPSGTDEIPDYYRPQVEWQALVCDFEEVDVVALIGSEMRHYRIARDRELGDMLLKIGADFMERHVIPRVPPPLDGTQAARAILHNRFPRHRPETMREWEPIPLTLASDLAIVKREIKGLEAKEEMLSQLLKERIGDSEGFGLSKKGPRVSWKTDANGKISWKEVSARFRPFVPAQQAAAIESACVGTPPRVLRLAGFKE